MCEIRTRKIYISYQVSKKSDFLGYFQVSHLYPIFTRNVPFLVQAGS